jgi:hypothetical protein
MTNSMTAQSLLERTLAENLTWNRARIKFLAAFLRALLQAKTVNLAHLAVIFGGGAQVASHYKRMQRFFRWFVPDEAELARLILRLLKLEGPLVLTIDRTEWQLGRCWVNVLMLAVAHEGVAVPLLWEVFAKKGCSSDEEREALLAKYVGLFGSASIKYVTADREFASRRWLRYLACHDIPFCLRLKANTQVTDKRGRLLRASHLVRCLRVGEQWVSRRQRVVWGLRVRLGAVRKANGDHMLVMASGAAGDPLAEYRLRWQIETLFGCLKTRGFRLEDTHLTETARVGRLLGLLALAFCWSWLAGEYVTRRRPLREKKHGRLEKSVFRAGLDYLRRHLWGLATKGQEQELKRLILLLSCT